MSDNAIKPQGQGTGSNSPFSTLLPFANRHLNVAAKIRQRETVSLSCLGRYDRTMRKSNDPRSIILCVQRQEAELAGDRETMNIVDAGA